MTTAIWAVRIPCNVIVFALGAIYARSFVVIHHIE